MPQAPPFPAVASTDTGFDYYGGLGNNGEVQPALVTLFDLLRRMGLVNNLWALVLMASVGGQVAGVFKG